MTVKLNSVGVITDDNSGINLAVGIAKHNFSVGLYITDFDLHTQREQEHQ